VLPSNQQPLNISHLPVYNKGLRICFSLFLGLLGVLTGCMRTEAQVASLKTDSPFNDNVFMILHYPDYIQNSSNPVNLSEILNTKIDGILLQLTLAPSGKEIIIQQTGAKNLVFRSTLVNLRKMLDADFSRIFTLILDFDFDASRLKQEFEEAGLWSSVYTLAPGGEWPSLQYLMQTRHPLIVFTRHEVSNRPGWLHSLPELAVEPRFSTSGELLKPESFLQADPAKSLHVYNGYLHRTLQYEGDFETFTRNRPHVLDLFVDTWNNTGKIPNFVMIDDLQWLGSDFIMKLRSFDLVKGMATYHADWLPYLEWSGIQGITSGKFCFPLLPGDRLVLIPQCPGYRFKPIQVIIDKPTGASFVQFTAIPELLAKDLEAYLPLKKNTRDLSPNKRNGIGTGLRFVKDPERGTVAEFSKGNHIGLEKASVLHITDHDFTVAVWIRIPETINPDEDLVILGSKTFAYQRGMHLIIRQGKPYMGFFNNDLAGTAEIQKQQWVHLVWRYNKLNGEQAIFVNGKQDANALNRPSYKGSDSLYVGLMGFNDLFGFDGAMCDLMIWSRTLGDDEIQGLYNQTLTLPMQRIFFWRWPVWTGPLILLLLIMGATAVLVRRRYAKRNKPGAGRKDIVNPVQSHSGPGDRNLIRLFGDFTVVDAQGHPITHLFTPKLKQLFIALLVNSVPHKTGLSPREISEMLWEGQESRDTKNKRAVTLRNLRLALSGLPDVTVRVENRWLIHFPETVSCDYYRFLQIIGGNSQNKPGYFDSLWNLIKLGEFCKDESHPWLDEVKSETGTVIMDYLSEYMSTLQHESDMPLIISICDQIFLYDPTHENALTHKVQALLKTNKQSQAKLVYDKFCAVYLEMYGQKYSTPYNVLIQK
jgi:hypothetical protein